MRKRHFQHRSLFSSPVPKILEKPKMKWRVLPILWTAIKKTCTLIGATVLILCLFTIWSASSLIEEVEVSLPNQMVLYMEMTGNLDDLSPEASFSNPFATNAPTVKDFVDTLHVAKSDPRVNGIFARMENGGYSLAHIQEMRAAIKDFRTSGKFAYIYSSSFAESGGIGAYYLASAFDEIWMQPMGVLSIAGVHAEMPFVRDVLDKIGVEPQFFQRKEYKTAYESFKNSEMSKANREMTTKMIGDITDTITADLSAETGLAPHALKALVDQGVFVAEDALEAKLIDQAAYADVLVKRINTDLTGNPESLDISYVSFSDYMSRVSEKPKFESATDFLMAMNSSHTSSPHFSGGLSGIALIYAVGVIMPSDTNAMSQVSISGERVAAADQIAEAIMDATEDASIKAIVLRVNSPGGSPTASETILRALALAKEKGKLVVVSMGPMAASGGYWISANADRIFALPVTMTGSIGVLGGKVSLEGLWEKVGVNWDGVKWGKNAGIWSMNTPFSKSEAEQMNAMLDHIYDNFIQRVAEGRKMELSQVEKIARGRVWTGRSALEIGLVDEIGGLSEALDYVAKEIGGTDRYSVPITIMPKPLSPMEQFLNMLDDQVRAGEWTGVQASVLQVVAPMIQQWHVLSNPHDYAVYQQPVNLR